MNTTPERQENIEQIFDDFLENAPEDESSDEMIEALDDVIYKALLEKLGYSNSSIEQKKLVRQKMNEFMINMDFNTPSLAHAEKMLRSIGGGHFANAAKYLQMLHALRAKTFSHSQSQKVQKPRKRDPVGEILERLVQLNPKISAEDAIAQMESDTYNHSIADSDEENIYYETEDGREKFVAKSNIPSRLARLRNSNK